jgi:hypothetical protein
MAMNKYQAEISSSVSIGVCVREDKREKRFLRKQSVDWRRDGSNAYAAAARRHVVAPKDRVRRADLFQSLHSEARVCVWVRMLCNVSFEVIFMRWTKRGMRVLGEDIMDNRG